MTDIAALVERLRERHPFHPIYVEAADALEACQAERGEFRSSLATQCGKTMVEQARVEQAEAEIERLRKDRDYWHHRYTEVCMGFTRPLDPLANVPENEGFDGPQGAN